MKKANDEVTILINSCDAYEDAWMPFFFLFNKYWPDCPYRVMLNTESKVIDNAECLQLYTNKAASYSERLIEHLRKIESDYVLLLMDDFFFRRPVDMEKINICLEALKQNPDIAVFSFDSIPDENNIYDQEYAGFVLRPKYCRYKFNLQGALWRRQALISLLRAGETPWELEFNGTIRAFEDHSRYYALEDIVYSPIDYGKKRGLTWGIVRGKWVKEDIVELFLKHDIFLDYSLRGFWDPVQGEQEFSVSNQKKVFWQDIKSFGLKIWLKMKIWNIFINHESPKARPSEWDYMEYMIKNKH